LTRFPIEAFGNDGRKKRKQEFGVLTMDLIYLGITAALLLLTWGLFRICELPPEGTKSSSPEEQEFGGKS
jgi:hypothetical protein